MTIEEKDLAWAAGFFDGEGYITISRRNHRGYTGHYLRVGINHVAREPLDKFVELFGGKLEYTDKVVGNRKPRYRWIASTSRAAEVLVLLQPYIINKGREISLALQFQNSINPGNNQRLSEDVVLFRETIKQELMAQNASC